MSTKMVIELDEGQGAQTVFSAIEEYKTRIRTEIARGKRRLARFEQKYDVNTDYFLEHMAAEDLEGGDLEYVNWAGEAKLLAGLERELTNLENARFELF
jgi:hypothetical protein